MAEITGKNLYLKFGSTVLDTDYRSFSQSEEGGIVDTSAGSDANRTYLTTLKDGTASASILMQSGDTATWNAIAPTTGGSLTIAEEGTTAAKPKHEVYAYVTNRTKAMEYADVVVIDVAWQFSGAVTDSTY